MNHSPICSTMILVFALVLPGFSSAAEDAAANGADSPTAQIESLRERIEAQYPQFQVDAIHPTPIDGVYEVVSDTDVMYLTGDARYLLRGSLIDLERKQDLTSQRRNSLVHAKVESLGENSMLVYSPKQGPAQHTITVFTDPSCPYCRRLHEDLLTMVEQYPVRVRYLMFPRAGLGSEAAGTLQDIWCADDPQQAMTRAKRGKSVPARAEGCNAPVRKHFQAGRAVGVNGTPYLMIGDDGPVFSGYRPTRELLAMLGIKPQDGQANAAPE